MTDTTNNPPREQIIKTLKALPGVSHQDDYLYDTFRNYTCKSCVRVFESHITSSVQPPEIYSTHITLAEAVAALTPPDDGPVNYDWAAGLPGAKSGGGLMLFFRVPDSGKHLMIDFDGMDEISYVEFPGAVLAPPQTRPEFMSMLKLFGVEVVG